MFWEVSLVRCALRCIKYPLAHSFPVDGNLSLQQVCWVLTACYVQYVFKAPLKRFKAAVCRILELATHFKLLIKVS